MFNPFSMFQDETAVNADVVKDAQEKKSDALLVDVRMPEEYAQGHIDGSILIPLQVLSQRLQKLPDKTKTVYVYCRSGARSAQAVGMLKSLGYTHVHNMSGGLMAWMSKGYPLKK